MKNRKIECYKVGEDSVPVWLKYKLKKKVMPNGKVVYEYFSTQRFESLEVGDRIIKDRERIKIKRKGRK